MYERQQDSQVFYVLQVESILGKLPVVPVGDTGTIPYSMWQHAADFVGAGSVQPSIQGRELVTVVGGGTSTLVP